MDLTTLNAAIAQARTDAESAVSTGTAVTQAQATLTAAQADHAAATQQAATSKTAAETALEQYLVVA